MDTHDRPVLTLAPAPRYRPPVIPPVTLSPEVADRITTAFREMSAALDRLRPRMAASTARLQVLGEHAAEAGLDDQRPPTDPRERALWARRHRNTGPASQPFAKRGRA